MISKLMTNAKMCEVQFVSKNLAAYGMSRYENRKRETFYAKNVLAKNLKY